MGWRRKEVVHEGKRSYQVMVERTLYVSARSREDAKNIAFYEIKPGERVTGAVEDWW